MLHKKRAIRIRLRSKSIILSCYLVFDLSNLDFLSKCATKQGESMTSTWCNRRLMKMKMKTVMLMKTATVTEVRVLSCSVSSVMYQLSFG